MINNTDLINHYKFKTIPFPYLIQLYDCSDSCEKTFNFPFLIETQVFKTCVILIR